MSVYSMFFSPTGGTEKVMDILAEELSVEKSIDLSILDDNYGNYRFESDDVCLIGVPSYGGRVPGIVLERIKGMTVDGAVAVLVVVYGNRAYDDTLLELKEELKACGFQVKAAVAAVAEHSIMHRFGKGRPDRQDEDELRKYAKDLKKLIDDKENTYDLHVPGNSPYREYNGVPFKPKANKSCTQCGVCAKKCPVGAIPKNNPASVDAEKCISCMRCVTICPHDSRNLNKFMLFLASQKMKKNCSSRKENQLFIS